MFEFKIQRRKLNKPIIPLEEAKHFIVKGDEETIFYVYDVHILKKRFFGLIRWWSLITLDHHSEIKARLSIKAYVRYELTNKALVYLVNQQGKVTNIRQGVL